MEEAGSLIDELDPTTSSSSYALFGGGSRGGGREEEDEDRRGRDSPKRGKLLLEVANVGGSLTVLLQVALVAWGIRQLRSFLARRRQSTEDARRAVDPPFAMLSPVAVKNLVELDPVKHFFIDVRYPAAVNETPSPFETVLHIPEPELKASLELSESDWDSRFPSVKKLGQNDMLVFLSTKGLRAQTAATAAANLGYSGCCVLSGGIEAYIAAMNNQVDVPLKFLSRSQVPGIQT